MEKINHYLCRLARIPIHAYRVFIRPILPLSCRFYPSCSEYALIAIQKHGLIKGTTLILCRLGRCHPWCDGGYDPVPNEEKT